MKATILALCAVCAAGVHAQIAQVSAPQRMLAGVESDIYNPVLSADGTKLMFSDVDYSNPRVYDMTDKVTRKVSLTKSQTMNGRFDKRGAVAPATVRTDGSTLYIKQGGTERAYSPVECTAGYCWAQLSPDGQKVVFLAAGKGLVVCDLQGRVLATPGNYESPAWFGNDYLVVQHATDDGHQIASSQILLISLDGTRSQALTAPESMAMTPTASAQAGLVVYSTIDGRLYKQQVKLNK